ncbi:MAG: protein-glutamate O-methyltransferase CheR [Desulfobacteraceae bacterium]
MLNANMDIIFKKILDCLERERRIDFSGLHPSMVQRRIDTRVIATGTCDYSRYLNFIEKFPEELDCLIDVLTINVSRFFRNSLVFEYLAKQVLPGIIHEKNRSKDPVIRIWSAGCAKGEEAYSMAILLDDIMEKKPLRVELFATDIDKSILKKAALAEYGADSIQSVKYRLLKKYFINETGIFRLVPEIKTKVLFSVYDLLSKKGYAPPESIYGSFDIIMCRNVLIYFDLRHQEMICRKMYKSLADQGLLVLGDVETPPGAYRRYFKQITTACPIYRKA